MRNLIRGAQFKRDVKLAERRGKDLAKLRELILLLVEGDPLLPCQIPDDKDSCWIVIGPTSSGMPARPRAVISATRLLISGVCYLVSFTCCRAGDFGCPLFGAEASIAAS
jgi:hypothetical protein